VTNAIKVTTAGELLAETEAEDRALLNRAARAYDLHPVIKQFGTWAVTEYGLECLARYYPIAMEQLYEDGAEGWPLHMAGKKWVEMCDVLEALYWARKRLAQTRYQRDHAKKATPQKKGLGLRFAILRRDGYRCQICGKTAADGASLEVDHKHPKSRGGKNDPANLWVLCFDCNRGKGANDL
jgi:hypothetical protein